MRFAYLATAAIAVSALTGCAVMPPMGPTVVVMPAQGKTFEAFQADDGSCRQYAQQQIGISATDAASNSLVGSFSTATLIGVAAGAAIGAAAGNPAAGVAIGASSGAVLGTAAGVGAAHYSSVTTQRRYDISYVQCMSAKGENVPQMTGQSAYRLAPYPDPAYDPYYQSHYYPPWLFP